MLTEFLIEDKAYIARAREVFIRMSLLVITGISCFLILRPFLDLLIAGIIIAIGIYPGYLKLTQVLRGRSTLAAVLCTLVLLAVTLVPMLLLGETLAGGVRNIADQLQAGQLKIPPPPPILDKVPVVGVKLKEFWTLSSDNMSAAVSRLAPQIRKYIPALVATSVNLGGVLIRFLIAILLAGFLLATSEQRIQFADRLFARIFDDQGPDFEQLVASTIRTVTNGVLGVAVIQSALASLGFWVAGLPGAGVWAVVFLIAAVLQLGGIVLVPAVLYAFSSFSTSHAVVFLIWCIFVGTIDNILKPILLGRGSKVPIAVVFLGVLGGFIMMRLIGLFVGAIILSVGYKLLMAWLDAGIPSTHRAAASTTAAA
ncbi:MAG TPA: AI-2E family transporter [Candidatus Eisenbacteria bacterium]|nr:AI-2E family transporter [Candidatus Eisenbacteria bacterium]